MLQLLYISTFLALLVMLVCACLVFFHGRNSKDEVYNLQRRIIVSCMLVMVASLLLSFTRNRDGQIEVLQAWSMLMYYLVFEAFFFASTAFNRDFYYHKKSYWVFFNNIAVLVLLTILYVHYVIGYNDHFMSLHDFIDAYYMGMLSFYTRMAAIFCLTGYIIIMSVLIYQSFARRFREWRATRNLQWRTTRLGRVLMFWLLVLVAMYVGLFVNEPLYHVVVMLLTCGLFVYATEGYLKFYRVVEQKDDDEGLEELRERMRTWLSREPFPLQQPNITMDEVATAIAVSREELSHYIYDVFGLTFTSWLSDCKLNYCRKLLRTTDLSMSEIAYQAGYGGLAAMSKAFKHKYGIPPSHFRKHSVPSDEENEDV
jgi:AraC-like DNA-binding protein